MESNTIGEIHAALKELRGMQDLMEIRVKELRAKVEAEAARHAEAEQRTVVAAGRIQWSVPDQPAIEGQAYLDNVTRKCSACGTRQTQSLIHGRLRAKYMGKQPSYEHSRCQSCNAEFI